LNEYLSILNTETYINHLAKRWRNGCEEFLIALRISLIILPFLTTLHYLQHPENGIYLTSLVPKDVSLIFYIFMYIITGIARLALQLTGWLTVMGICFPIIGFIFTLLQLIQEIK
jgi:hypothetical protein